MKHMTKINSLDVKKAVMMKSALIIALLVTFVLETKGQISVCSVSDVTGDSGTLTSPNYPSDYDNNLDCEKTVSTSSDKVLRITFDLLDIKSDSECSLDYLEVLDGTELYTGERLCGTQKPRNFVSATSSVKIVFHSDSSNTRQGFSIQWITEARCPDDEFSCWNGMCIPSSEHCDGVKHCPDNSDEITCVQNPSTTGECGKVQVAPQFTWNPRIVGGNEAVEGSWPWQVGITSANGVVLFCGGSILSTDWILTAAHCFDASKVANPTTVRVDAGKHSFSGGANQSSIVREVIVHESYQECLHSCRYVSSFDTGFDIALLRMQTPLRFSKIVSPICIPTSNFTFGEDVTVIATGWGTLASEGKHPSRLHQVRLPVVSNNVCNTKYSSYTIFDSQMCAGDTTTGGVDSCQGDSGGPAVILVGESTWFQVGITSYGISCANPSYPGVYTRVSSYEAWITEKTALDGTTTTTTTSTNTNVVADVCDNAMQTSNSGILRTPNYPQNYDNNLDCTTTISTTLDKVIEIVFVFVDIEETTTCNWDYMEVYDGTEMYTGKRFCGTQEPRNFVSSSSTVRIVFHSDIIVNRQGFEIQWAAKAKCSSSEFSCWNGNCTSLTEHCDGTNTCGDDSDEIECTQEPLTPEECGKVLVPPKFTWDPRIVGGNEAVSGSWPWQAGIKFTSGSTPFCGGSILFNDWILTAAHCVDGYVSSPSSLIVEAGEHTFDGVADQSVVIQNVIVHPQYTSESAGFDIALLKLSTSLTFNNIVRSICVPSAEFSVAEGSTVIATGWGRLASEGSSPTTLNQVRVPVINNTVCATKYPSFTIFDSQICAGDTTTGGVDSCQGDSGGPLVMLVGENSWYQLGITSYGTSCADPNFPGVYTRVSFYSSWITSNTGVTSGSTIAPITTISGSLSTFAFSAEFVTISTLHVVFVCFALL